MTVPAFCKFLAATLFAGSLAACGGAESDGRASGDGGSFDAATVDPSTQLDTLPALADRIIADSSEVTTLLARVNDPASAEAVKPRLAEMAESYRAVLTKFDTMGEPGLSDMAALAGRLPRIATSQTELLQQIERIYREHPDAYDVLAESLDGLGRTTP